MRDSAMQPKRHPDGSLYQTMLTVGGKHYHCPECGCNVFHHPDETDLKLYECNGCGIRLEAE
jgi:hypothetical protein